MQYNSHQVIEEASSLTPITKKMGEAAISRQVCDYLGAGSGVFIRKIIFFPRNEYPLTGGTSCDGMDYGNGFSRITNQGS
jgi:hypothetical protein